MTKLFATAFWTSLLSYGFFGLAEYVRPGFVSFHFSLHWLLLLTIVFALLWGHRSTDGEEPVLSSKVLGFGLKAIASFVIFALLWREGAAFGDVRPFLALVAAFLPWMVSSTQKFNPDDYDHES